VVSDSINHCLAVSSHGDLAIDEEGEGRRAFEKSGRYLAKMIPHRTHSGVSSSRSAWHFGQCVVDAPTLSISTL